MHLHPVVEKIYHRTLVVFAIVIVFCAVVFTATRVSTPLLNLKKSQFEQLASKMLGAPIVFNRIAFGWHGIDPEMSLQDVTVYRSYTQHKEIFHIAHLYIALSVIHSMMQGKVLPAFITASGMKVSVKQEPKGGYKINDLTIKQVGKNEQNGLKSSLLRTWLLAKDRVYLRNIEISYHPLKAKAIRLNLRSLNLVNADSYHQLSAILSVFSKHPVAVKLIMQAKGDLTNLKNLQAKLYIDVKHVNANQIPQKKNFWGYRLNQGTGEDQTWLAWQNGKWQSIVSDFNFYNLALTSNNTRTPLLLKHLSGVANWQNEAKGWQFSLSNLNIITQTRVWPTVQFNLSYEKQHHKAHWDGGLSFLDLGGLRQLMLGVNQLPSGLKAQLAHFRPTGLMQNIEFSNTGPLASLTNVHLKASIEGLSIHPWRKVPGIKNLSGHLNFSKNAGVFHLDSTNVQFNFNHLFRHPLILQQAKGTVTWKKNKTTLTIKTKHLVAANNDFGIYGQLALQFLPKAKQPYISLLAGFYTKNPVAMKKYIPQKGLSPHMRDWLQHAILGGSSLTGKIILRGNLQYFPFLDQRGVFQVQAHIDKINFRYAKQWPDLNAISGDLLFSNNSLVGKIKSGNILGAAIDDAWINIPALRGDKNPRLTISADVAGSDKQLVNFIDQSPLKKNLGKVFSQMHVAGQTNLRLHMNIPLRKVNSITVDGKLSLAGDQLNLPQWMISVNHLSGILSFTKQTVSAKELKGVLFSEPIVINISTLENKNQQTIKVAFNSIASISSLKKQFPWLKQSKVYGSTKYNGLLQFNLGEDHSQQDTLLLQSDLYGLNLNYPSPFAKPFPGVKSFKVDVDFGLNKPAKLFVDYGNLLHSAILFKQTGNKTTFYSALFRFGGARASIQKQPGLIVDGVIPEFDWQQWKPLFVHSAARAKQPKAFRFGFDIKSHIIKNDNVNSFYKDESWLEKSLRYIDLKIKTVSVLGLQLVPVAIKLSYADNAWLMDIASNTIQGRVEFPDDFPRQAITGSFDRLYLPALQSKSKTKFNPEKIPPLDLRINDFRYTNKDFGEVDIDVAPIRNELDIKNLNFSTQLLSGDIHGWWWIDGNNTYQTHLSGWLNSPSISSLLKLWDVKSDLIATGGEATFDLSWPGAPYQINPKWFVGKAAVQLDHGWFVGLSKPIAHDLSLGRVINIFSVRHLLFNFNDITHKGYSFDSLRGNLTFDSGVVSTKNLQTSGSVADIHMKGKINLITKYIDVKLAILVNATGSLPVIATVASGFNPIIGAATWVVDKIVHKVIDHSYQYDHEIIGFWSNPKVIKLQ